MVGGAVRTGEESVEEGGFAGAGRTEEVSEEDVAFGFGGAFSASSAFAGFGEVQGGCYGVVWRVVSEVGEIGESGLGGDESGHAPLGEPALKSDVVGFVADGRRRKGIAVG